MRAWKLLMLCLSTPGSVLAVGAKFAFTVPVTLLKVSAGNVLRWNVRADPKNQILSLLIGPPSDPRCSRACRSRQAS